MSAHFVFPESSPSALKRKKKIELDEERMIEEAIEEANKERERLAAELEAKPPMTEEENAAWLRQELENERWVAEVRIDKARRNGVK